MNQAFTVTSEAGFSILRDDLLPGGTKRRGLTLMLEDIRSPDCVYAGTIFGHGALALTLACADQGKRAHLFLSCNDASHPMLKKLEDAGAHIHVADPLPVALLYDQAAVWASSHDACLFPLAFDSSAFHSSMIRALHMLDVTPYSEVWCASVSGTLARALQGAYPDKPVKTVSVVAAQDGAMTAPEKYHRTALTVPPYPSCPYTDAKVWQFVREHAHPDALIWNTAG